MSFQNHSFYLSRLYLGEFPVEASACAQLETALPSLSRARLRLACGWAAGSVDAHPAGPAPLGPRPWLSLLRRMPLPPRPRLRLPHGVAGSAPSCVPPSWPQPQHRQLSLCTWSWPSEVCPRGVTGDPEQLSSWDGAWRAFRDFVLSIRTSAPARPCPHLAVPLPALLQPPLTARLAG